MAISVHITTISDQSTTLVPIEPVKRTLVILGAKRAAVVQSVFPGRLENVVLEHVARLLGIEQIGLAALVERFLGIAMTKDSQKSDWSRRPLSEKQLRYAINDTRHLEVLAERLHRELLQRGRVEWHRESCCAMVDATRRDRPRDAQQAWRIKGAGRLTPRQLAYLREIWSWRDERARRADRPTFKVLGNRQLLELVQWVESNPDEPLDQGLKLPRDIVGSRRRALKDALDRAASLTSAEWPKRESAPRVHAPPIDQRQFDVLRSDCSKIAEGLAIAPSTLALDSLDSLSTRRLF